MTTITLNGTLVNDQSESTQDNDVAISYDSALNTFSGSLSAGFLDGLDDLFNGTIPLATAPADALGAYADTVEAAKRDTSFITVDPQGDKVTDLFFSDPNGDPLDGDQVFMDVAHTLPLNTANGDSIYLWSITDNFVIATTSNQKIGGVIQGDLVGAFYLNETADHLHAGVEMVTFQSLYHPDSSNPDDTVDWSEILNVSAATSLSFNFDALRSGSELWAVVGNSTNALLVTGGNPAVDSAGKLTNASDVIHSSQGGTGTTIGVNNQLFDSNGETAVFTFVQGFHNSTLASVGGAVGDYVVDPKPNDNKPEGIDYDGYGNFTGADIFISQSQGNLAKNLDINLFAAGPATEEGFGYVPGLGSDTPVDAATVTIIDDDGNPVGTWGVGGLASGTTVSNHTSTNGTANVQVTISGNNIDVNGLLGEYTVQWTTDGVETFNRFSVVAEGGAFDIGRVDVTQAQTITQNVGDFMFVDDDGPEALVGGPVDPLITDDTDIDGPSTDFVPVSSLFSVIDFNLDGAGTATVALSTTNDVSSGLTDTLTGDPIRFFKEAATGDVIGYADDNTNGTYDSGSDPIAVRYHIDDNNTASDISDDSVIFTQYRAVIHDDPNDPDEANGPASPTAGTVFVDLTVTDKDLDQAGASFDLSAITELKDDGPTLTGQTASIRVEEDELSTSAPAPADTSNGITDGDGTDDETDLAYADLITTLNPGKDLPATFALDLSVSGAVTDLSGTQMTSRGDAMTWAAVGSEVEAVAGGRIVFTITKTAGGDTADPTDDVFTVDLRDQVDQADASGDNGTITANLTPAFSASDADGDRADLNGPNDDLKTIQLVIENDVPDITSQILDGIVPFSAGSNVSNSLNGAIGADDNPATNLTADGTTTYTFDSFNIVSGLAGLTGTMSADKTKIEFKIGADLYYDIVLDQANAGQYDFTVYKTPPPAITNFGFDDLFAGQNLFGIIAEDKTKPDGPGLLVIADNSVLDPVTGEMTNSSGTINTSKGGGPTVIGNGNQSFDGQAPTEGAFFAYLLDPNDNAINGVGLDQNNADDADTVGFQGLHKVGDAQVELVHVNGPRYSASVSIKAFDVTVPDPIDTNSEARNFVTNPTAFSDAVSAVTQVNVEGVKIFDQTGKLVEWVKDVNNDGVGELQDVTGDGLVTNADNDPHVAVAFTAGGLGAIATGLDDFYSFEFHTTDDHNVAQIEQVAGAYDLGGFNLIQTNITADQQINFAVNINDYDGDSAGAVISDADALFKIGIDGTDPDSTVLFI